MGRATFWMALGAAALAGGGALFYYQNEQPGTAAPPAQAAVPAAERVIAVEAEPVVVDTVLQDIRAVGTLGPDESVVIAPEIAGRIDRIGFEEGDEVEAGAILVELDAAMLRAELTKTRSDLSLAEANQERANTLAQRGTGTLRARDEAVSAYQVAQLNSLQFSISNAHRVLHNVGIEIDLATIPFSDQPPSQRSAPIPSWPSSSPWRLSTSRARVTGPSGPRPRRHCTAR